MPPIVSFVLRCWADGAGHVRARLIDVSSGASHPIPDLAQLPALVARLIAGDEPGTPPAEAPAAPASPNCPPGPPEGMR